MKYILAIDQGTTGSRAIAFDTNGKIVATSYREFPQVFPKPGWVEHDPMEILKSVYHTIRAVLDEIPVGTVAAIGITNQRETSVVWDGKSGRPLYNAIVWQCRRTSKRCDEIKRDAAAVETIKEKTGLPVDAYFSATKIEWLLKNVPSVSARAKKGRLLFGTTDAWILWNLTGGAVHATDYTNASRTMLFNIKKKEWDDDILRVFGIPRSLLPGVKKSSGIYGTTVRCQNLPGGIPIAGIAGDQQAALFGQTCFEAGSIKNTYGTGSFILLNAGGKKIISKSGLITTLGCDAHGDPAYALEGSVFVAGAAVQWLRDGLKVIKSASETEEIARGVGDNGGVYFVPAFVGLGAPHWDQHARGSIVGITRGTKAAHLVRAALEAICFQTKDVVLAMEKDSGIKIRQLKVDGGASKNDFLCQFQADILGMEVVRPKVTEITSLGAAYLAGLAVGFWNGPDAIEKCWQHERTFRPGMSKRTAEGLYKGWTNALERTFSGSRTGN